MCRRYEQQTRQQPAAPLRISSARPLRLCRSSCLLPIVCDSSRSSISSQLTIDLLLSTLPHTLLGNFHSAHVLPCVGGDALAGSGPAPTTRKAKAAAAAAAANAPAVLTTAMQLFSIPTLRLLVLQQRAPAIRGRHRVLVNQLTEWASGLGLAQTILLTSSLAFRRGDEELDAVHSVSFFLVDNAAAPASASAPAAAAASSVATLLRDQLHWNSLHHSALQQDDAPVRFDSAEEADRDMVDPMRMGGGGGASREEEDAPLTLPPIAVPGLGITRPLFELVSGSPASAATSGSAVAALPPTLFLHVYVNEGANDRDAVLFAANLYALLFLQQAAVAEDAAKAQLTEPHSVVWTPPASWSTVFGNEPDESLYL